MWSLTFMVDGKKRVQHVPDECVEQIRPLVEQGREFKDAIAEVFAVLPNCWRYGVSSPQRRKKP